MKKVVMKKFLMPALVCAMALSAQAQTLVDTWSNSGGGLNLATYGGEYRPAVLTPDTGSAPGAGITYTGVTSGGLGSITVPEGYGGFYTNNSSSVAFTLQTSNVLTGATTITLSFLSGGIGTFSASSVTLSYNVGHSNVASSSYGAVPAGLVDTPIGEVPMTTYTWSWDVSSFGPSTGLTLNWGTGVHTFFDQVTMTQAVPEPSTYALLGLGLGVAFVLRRRSRKSSTLSA